MESLKRERPFDSSFSGLEEDARETKRHRSLSLDPLDHLPSQVFVQVLLDPQFDLSTIAWVFVRVSRRWKEAIESSLRERWRAVDVYHPFLWSSGPSLSGGLIPPMEPLLEEWGRQGWLGLLQWAYGLGFPLLNLGDKNRCGQHMLLAAACRGGHQPVVAWVLDDLGCYLDQWKAVEGACRSETTPYCAGWSRSVMSIRPAASPTTRTRHRGATWRCASGLPSTAPPTGGSLQRDATTTVISWSGQSARDTPWVGWYDPSAIVSGSLSPHTPQAIGAAEAGQLDTLAWLWERLGSDPEADGWERAIDVAASAGQLAAVEWLLDRGCKGEKDHIELAVRGGHVDVVALLWKRVGHDQSQHTKLVIASAHSGSLPMLQWAVDHGLPLTASACASAAWEGHLDALRFLRSHHCPWDGWTLKWAATHGHLDILQWALANGLPLDGGGSAGVPV